MIRPADELDELEKAAKALNAKSTADSDVSSYHPSDGEELDCTSDNALDEASDKTSEKPLNKASDKTSEKPLDNAPSNLLGNGTDNRSDNPLDVGGGQPPDVVLSPAQIGRPRKRLPPVKLGRPNALPRKKVEKRNVEIFCPFRCGLKTLRKFSLVRHCKRIHQCDPADPAFKEIKEKVIERCRFCAAWFGNRCKHEKVCAKNPTSKNFKSEPDKLPVRRMIQPVEQAELPDLGKFFEDIVDLPSVLECYRSYLMRRCKKMSTADVYSRCLHTVLKHLESLDFGATKPSFRAAKIFTRDYQALQEPDGTEIFEKIPVGRIGDFLQRQESAATCLAIVKALKVFLLLVHDYTNHCYDMREKRQKSILFNLRNVKAMLNTHAAMRKGKVVTDASTTQESRRESGRFETRPRAVFQLLQKLCHSSLARGKLEQLAHPDLPQMLEGGKLDPVPLRNCVMAFLATYGCGHRGVVYRSMKVSEWKNRKSEVSPEGMKITSISVAEHKTDATYGHAKIVFTNELLANAIEGYFKHVRPELVGKREQSSECLFLNQNATQMTLDRPVNEWFRAMFKEMGLRDEYEGDQFTTFSIGAIRKAFRQWHKIILIEMSEITWLAFNCTPVRVRDKFYDPQFALHAGKISSAFAGC